MGEEAGEAHHPNPKHHPILAEVVHCCLCLREGHPQGVGVGAQVLALPAIRPMTSRPVGVEGAGVRLDNWKGEGTPIPLTRPGEEGVGDHSCPVVGAAEPPGLCLEAGVARREEVAGCGCPNRLRRACCLAPMEDESFSLLRNRLLHDARLLRTYHLPLDGLQSCRVALSCCHRHLLPCRWPACPALLA